MARKIKDSGIEWIGEIPEGWEVHRMKSCISQRDGGAWGDEATGETGDCICLRIADFDYEHFRFTDSNNLTIRHYASPIIKKLLLQKNDILIEKSGGGEKTPVGRTVLFDKEYPALFANFMDRLRCSDFILPQYLQYVFVTFYKNRYTQNYIKQTTGIQNLDLSSMLADEFVPVPNLNEQKLIVCYLESKCSKIDNLLSKTRSSIEEYKKLKQAVITQAVTKGVRGEREMKDSRVEWIGAIPKDWEIKRLKSFCTIVDCKNRTPDVFPDGKYTVVRTTCIKDCSFSYEGSYQTDTTNFKAWTLKGQPHKGDIFFTREAPVGEACLVPNADNLCMGQRVMFFRPEDNSDARYIMYSIYGPLVREYIASKNSGSTVGHLKLGQVACIPIFYCPPLEQKEIADYLDAKCAEIDGLIEKKEQLVKELESYKKSLIYEVVTGKREV